MTNYEAYMAGLIPDTDPMVARYLKQGDLKPRTSLEATLPVAQAPERKRVWGAAPPVDTRNISYTRQTATPEESQMAWQQMKQDARQDIPQFAKGAAMGITTDVLGAPVDIATTALRPFGYDVPPEKVIGGSDWIADKLGVQPSGSGAETAGRLVGGLIDPATAAKAGSVALGKGMPLLAGITTYHGSPTSGIRQWDMSFRGTGEGRLAQGSETYKDMIGHGLYSAERESLGKGYQERLAKGTEITFEGKNIDDHLILYDDPNSAEHAFSFIKGYGGVEPAIKGLRETANKAPTAMEAKAWAGREGELQRLRNQYNNAADWLEKNKGLIETKASPGSLYETELLAHPDEFLLWDKPLSEQPKAIREALKSDKLLSKPPNNWFDTWLDLIEARAKDEGRAADMSDVYRALSQNLGSDKAASDYLASKGIAGVKYLDNPSRGAGEGTYNYVTFKPETEAIITHENQKRISGAVEEAYRRMRDPKGKALLEKRYPELKGLK